MIGWIGVSTATADHGSSTAILETVTDPLVDAMLAITGSVSAMASDPVTSSASPVPVIAIVRLVESVEPTRNVTSLVPLPPAYASLEVVICCSIARLPAESLEFSGRESLGAEPPPGLCGI